MYLVLDFETGTRKEYKRLGNPWFNEIVAAGLKYEGKEAFVIYKGILDWEVLLKDVTLIIGHNIKYDLLYIWKCPDFQTFLSRGGNIYDTQLGQFILSGQRLKYPALRDISTGIYGLPERLKYMESFWENTIDTCDIPEQFVTQDVLSDVLETEHIYLEQVKKAGDFNMLPLIHTHNDAILGTTEAEYNGMYVDPDILYKNGVELLHKKHKVTEELLDMIEPHWHKWTPFNLDSGTQLSKLFFEVLLEKPDPKWETKKKGTYSVNEEVLKILSKKSNTVGQISSKILELRGISKQVSTYYISTQELIYPDNCIHPQYSHVATQTGRLDCKNPNIQNQPKGYDSKVKEHFVSRYPNGVLIDVDFSQLEIVIQAQLSGDEKYIQDVVNGIDFHTKRLALVEKISYDKLIHLIKNQQDTKYIQKRSQIKGFSFARAYGAGPKTISENTGLSEEYIRDLIEKEALEYPKLTRYNKILESYVEHTAKAEKSNIGWYKNPLNRRFYFEGRPAAKWKKKEYEFPLTQIQNYIVQGTATCDISLIMFGKLFRRFLEHRDKFLLVNTVHDSYIIDCRAEHKDFCCNLIKEVLDSTVTVLEKEFNWKFLLPIKYDIKSGSSWRECT